MLIAATISWGSSRLPRSKAEFLMKSSHHLAFVLFATALLLSIVREWSAPAACPFPGITQGIPLGHQQLN